MMMTAMMLMIMAVKGWLCIWMAPIQRLWSIHLCQHVCHTHYISYDVICIIQHKFFKKFWVYLSILNFFYTLTNMKMTCWSGRHPGAHCKKLEICPAAEYKTLNHVPFPILSNKSHPAMLGQHHCSGHSTAPFPGHLGLISKLRQKVWEIS